MENSQVISLKNEELLGYKTNLNTIQEDDPGALRQQKVESSLSGGANGRANAAITKSSKVKKALFGGGAGVGGGKNIVNMPLNNNFELKKGSAPDNLA